ncbi:MAG: flagellar biosynthesis protein FliQ [Erysipelotrichaceae bacterium]|nr:flagellar biosynthesis protein FliQ [Erysipelotrichaceae bacterium]
MMTESIVLEVLTKALMTILYVSMPILVISLVVGLLISILQATTQVQEQTLSFVPKLMAVFLGMILFGSFMLHTLMSFTEWILSMIAGIS